MHEYVCICMYVYVCICMCTYVYICICMHAYVGIYVYVCICMYVYVCICMYMYVCICMHCMYVCHSDCVWVTGLTFVQDSSAGDSVTLAMERVIFSIVVEVVRLVQLMSEEINQYIKRAPKVTMFSVMVLQQHIVTLVDTTTKKQCKCDITNVAF